MHPIVEAEEISKEYKIQSYRGGYTTLRDQISEAMKHPTRALQKLHKEKETFFALKEVSFSIQQGESVGLIGANGAGKSTLLKLLSRITPPSHGKITLRGSVASLLEVGTGFHPELSGRENIFLNGAILGMSRREMLGKFDEIVDFSGIEKFLDTPMKFYSTGMYVRLAFAVAAHIESDILLVDEVLAVGDAEFQKKCLGKIKEISGGGRTIIFVSHNIEAVKRLCSRGLLLHKGTLVATGDINTVTRKYLETGNLSQSSIIFDTVPSGAPGFPTSLRIENNAGELEQEISVGKRFQIRVRFTISEPIEHFIIAIGLKNTAEVPIRTVYSMPKNIMPGIYEALFIYDDVMMASGAYPIMLGLSSYENSFFYRENIAAVHISDISSVKEDARIVRTKGAGIILNPIDVTITKL
jgi:lipopolysaccharide transport system ATP-binding protein